MSFWRSCFGNDDARTAARNLGGLSFVFQLHERLAQDSFDLGRFDGAHVLLHRNAAWGWMILVPHTDQTDLFQMPEHETLSVLEQVRRLTQFLRSRRQFSKINFAMIGNVVPQLHLHVIGRRPNDAGWPAPVWGYTGATESYDESTVLKWREELVSDYGLMLP